MDSLPSSGRASWDKMQSMTEVFNGKYFPMADSCPLRIDVKRIPLVEETSSRSGTKRKPTAGQATERIIFPPIGGETTAGSDGLFSHKNAEQELKNSISKYRTSFFRPKSLNQPFDFMGPSACRTDFENFTQTELEVVLERREEKMEESNALKRWEYWMRDRRRMQSYLEQRLQKSPSQLLLQDSDKIRRKLESRWMNTCHQMPEPDKWRGHPFRWKAEFRLPNRKIRWNDPKVASPPQYPPQYCAARTSIDKGEIPDVEFIGIPQTVQKEKGFVQKYSTEENGESLHAEETQYFFDRRRQTRPQDMDMDLLEVIGKKIIEPKEEPEEKSSRAELPQITINEATDYSRSEDPSVFCLVIGDEVIKYDITAEKVKVPSRTFHWNIDFDLNTVGALAERSLRVENRGTLAIRYHWLSEKPPRPMNLEKLQPRQYEPWFFFNKNSGFFLPGQIYHLKFYHHSKFSGIRKEVWHLKTEPPLSLSSDPCTVTLSAIATEEISSRNPLEKYLFDRVKMSIVETMIEIILEKVLRPPSLRGIEYRSIFSSKILFEYNNPKRYYNSTLVKGLNKIYDEIITDSPDWDLSIDTLVCQVKSRRIGKERNSILFQVAGKANLLFKPTYVSVRQDKKFRMAYAILCKMINIMEDDYNLFRNLIPQKPNQYLKERRMSADENSVATPDVGEYGESDYYNAMDLEINPVDLLFFKTMFYLKVYHRMCQAAEHIAGMIETARLFEPWRQIDYKASKPQRRIEDTWEAFKSSGQAFRSTMHPAAVKVRVSGRKIEFSVKRLAISAMTMTA